MDQNVARRLGRGRVFQRLDDLGGRGAGFGRQQRSDRAGQCGRFSHKSSLGKGHLGCRERLRALSAGQFRGQSAVAKGASGQNGAPPGGNPDHRWSWAGLSR
jgi:hypothetical protein